MGTHCPLATCFFVKIEIQIFALANLYVTQLKCNTLLTDAAPTMYQGCHKILKRASMTSHLKTWQRCEFNMQQPSPLALTILSHYRCYGLQPLLAALVLQAFCFLHWAYDLDCLFMYRRSHGSQQRKATPSCSLLVKRFWFMAQEDLQLRRIVR